MNEEAPPVSPQTWRALDAVNFLMADVLTGVGPFLAIYLRNSLHWDAAKVGVAMSAGGIAAILAQTPAGGFVDHLRHKREAIAVGAALVGVVCILMAALKSFAGIIGAQVVLGIVGSFFPPAMAGMTLGIVGAAGLDRRIGRNETFNHAGNVVAALGCGAVGYYFQQRDIFFFVSVLCFFTVGAVFFVRRQEIDYERSRGGAEAGKPKEETKPARIWDLLKERPLLVFVISVVLFHFSNAAMLPLIGQRLADGHARASAVYMAVCIVGAQLVMVPVAMFAGRFASLWGRKAVFLLGLGVLPIRGILYTVNDNPYFLIGVQLLDGIGAAIFGVVSVLVIADLTRGTGRFNLTQGMVATATGLGAALSNGIAGYVVKIAGYNTAFLFLAAIAAAGCALFYFAMPETKRNDSPAPLPNQIPATT
jgi:MFS family permease